MTRARSSLIDPGSTPYYHCMARCVRRAYLCGEDHLTGKSFEHRRQWVVDRLQALVSIFAIEVCAYAVMSNHYHVVLHINSRDVESWSRDEVLQRWTTLFTGPMLVQRYMSRASLSSSELSRVDEYVDEYRLRLKSVSWFMRCLNEYLAREANKEDGCKGRFWEGRFKSQALLDEAALLTCMAYVDLNPIRAKLAPTPEQSDYTSIQKRIGKTAGAADIKQPSMLKAFQCQGQNPDEALPYILHDYLELVDWSGRVVRADKKGSIPEGAPPILTRLEIDPDEWLKTMSWNNRFYRAAGRLKAMKAYALNTGQQWLQGLHICSRLFKAC
ncbi:transposase [Endozoicomonas numazuensis]|uniref:Transposase n=1 Tax=Endozoicomonas numazuensis TaxID=1137799 RepID=A0A081NCH7_9GAMM|nr:transposase [Endozoicomonas numazuensis]KEQ16150.1 transposase [Endozoicomonas numazuensis]